MSEGVDKRVAEPLTAEEEREWRRAHAAVSEIGADEDVGARLSSMRERG